MYAVPIICFDSVFDPWAINVGSAGLRTIWILQNLFGRDCLLDAVA